MDSPRVVQQTSDRQQVGRVKAFPGLETFTGQLGAYVPAAETVATCRAILDGVYDKVDENEFLFVTSFGQ